MSDGSQPERSTRHGSVGGRLLALGAIALMLFGATFPIFGVGPSRDSRILMILAVITAILGVVAPQGSSVAFMLLWASLGMSAALGTLAIFSFGLLYFIAALFLLFAIFATPNNSRIASRYNWRYVIAFCAGLIAVMIPMFA